MFWQPELETMKRSEINALQLERLKRIARYCYDNVPFYHRRFDSVGFDPGKIRTLSDVRYIPYTTKEDLRDNYPFGLFAQPMEKVVRLHASSGTTGKPTVVGYTRGDMENWTNCVARFCVSVGVNSADIAQITFGYGLFTGALGLHQALTRIGVTVIPASSGNTEKQVMLLKDLGATVIVGTPSYALHIGEVAESMGITGGSLALRIGLLGSEGCSNEFRAQVEKKLGIFATDNYGISELIGPGVAGECSFRAGHHIAEDHFLPEIIDPDTGEVKDAGERGELVVTTLTKEALPLLRYRTKDITVLDYEPCRCGRTHVRMAKPMGRSDDMLKIKGVNVFPSQIESVLINIADIGPHYQLIVRTLGAGDALEVRVELVNGSLLESYGKLEKLTETIRHRLHVVLGIDCKVSLVAPNTIERTAGKARRVIDLRERKW